MKINKDLLPIIGLVLMTLITAADAFLLVQTTGNAIYLTLILVALPLFLVILFVLLFRLKGEPDSHQQSGT